MIGSGENNGAGDIIVDDKSGECESEGDRCGNDVLERGFEKKN